MLQIENVGECLNFIDTHKLFAIVVEHPSIVFMGLISSFVVTMFYYVRQMPCVLFQVKKGGMPLRLKTFDETALPDLTFTAVCIGAIVIAMVCFFFAAIVNAPFTAGKQAMSTTIALTVLWHNKTFHKTWSK